MNKKRRDRNNLRRMQTRESVDTLASVTVRTIEEVAQITGLSLPGVRYYETRALLKLWALAQDEELKAMANPHGTESAT